MQYKLKSNERWQDCNWTKIDNKVLQLQKKIYNAAKENNYKKLRNYQNMMLSSYYAKLKAVRRVTQDNSGKKTAGIDGVKSLLPEDRIKLAKNLSISKPRPVRRVWIPKKGTSEKRPLGIPTMKDRAVQALIKLLLEPEWEARFEKSSYGFRPGRRAHDATRDILNHILKKPKYVLDADITKCFDRIEHNYLLNKLNFNKGKIHWQLKQWLKAGIMDEDVFQETVEGTPQGGIISPLLANIALHGMETHLKEYVSENFVDYYPSGKKYGKVRMMNSLGVIRYADDFVVTHEREDIIKSVKYEITKFLKPIGLELNESKTSFKHTRTLAYDTSNITCGIKPGFNFLGFTFRNFESNHRSSRSVTGNKLGFKTLVYPSAESRKDYLTKLHDVVLIKGRNLKQSALIKKLNPIISGWSRYYGVSDANTMNLLSSMDYNLYLMLRKWAKRSKRSSKKAIYLWKSSEKDKWIFGNEEITLLKHVDYSSPLNNYVKILNYESPYSPNVKYWERRLSDSLELNSEKSLLIKRQKGICAYCSNKFTIEDILETDHIIPLKLNGADSLENKQLLHRHCHHSKTKIDKKVISGKQLKI